MRIIDPCRDRKTTTNNAGGARVGGKHAQGNTKHGTSVNDIKNKLDKESAAARPTGATQKAAAA